MAVSISLGITQNSQNIANNTSNVTVKVTAKWTGGSFNRNDPSGSCTINGTKYTFTSDFNASQTTSGSQVIYSKTLNITHNSDGTKTLSCSASFATGVSSGTVTASASKTLTTIPRKSTMSVGNGTLGTAQTLTVTRKSTSFTHTITATCGSASTTICTKSTSTSIAFTPPLAWASQNTTGTSVSVKYTITTYSGSTSVGSNSYTVSCSIPASVKPSVSMTVSDPTGYLSTYGGYVQGLSKFTVSLSASGSYSSTIKSYSTTANGATYTASSFTTGVITGSGTLSINTTVTDSRSRTATASKSVTVLAYAVPKISAFTVARCNQDGTANSGGSYMKVTFSSSVTSLNSKNKSTYTLKYKKSTDSAYTTVTLSNYANNYAVSGGSYIFAADTASSYNVTLTLADNFKSVSTSGTGSTATKTMSLYKQGKGVAFGKIAEKENGFECAYPMYDRFGEQIGNGLVTSLENDPDTTNQHLILTTNNTPSGKYMYILTFFYQSKDSSQMASYSRMQMAIPYHYAGVMYWRYYFFNNKAWSSWFQIPTNAAESTLAKLTLTGDLYFNSNNMRIWGKTTTGTVIEALNTCAGDNRICLGYGSYSGKIGATSIYGDTIYLYSNNTIQTDRSIRFANAKYATGTDTSGNAYDLCGLSSSNVCLLGNASIDVVLRGKTVKLGSTSGSAVTSDRNLKTNIEDVDEKYIEFFKMLQPKTYKYKLGNAGRSHIGFIAQDVEDALINSGLSSDEFGGICIDDVKYAEENEYDERDDMNYAYKQGLKKVYSLRYEEFISLNTRMIQEVMKENEVLKDKVDEQQQEIDDLKDEVQRLKELVEQLVS